MFNNHSDVIYNP